MKRVFISFAIEDSRLRDLLVGQAKNNNSPFEFVDMSVKRHGVVSGRQNVAQRSRDAMECLQSLHRIQWMLTGNAGN